MFIMIYTFEHGEHTMYIRQGKIDMKIEITYFKASKMDNNCILRSVNILLRQTTEMYQNYKRKD